MLQRGFVLGIITFVPIYGRSMLSGRPPGQFGWGAMKREVATRQEELPSVALSGILVEQVRTMIIDEEEK